MVNKRSVATASRGRPKSLEKRAAIRNAAVKLFLQEGIENTSMDAIANHAGVSKQTVYSHFKSKDELFSDCVKGKLTQYKIRMDANSHSSLAEALLQLSKNLLELMRDPDVLKMHRLLISNCVDFPELINRFFDDGPKLLHHYHPDQFRSADEKPAKVYISLILGCYFRELLMNYYSTLSDEEIETHSRESVRQFLKMYGLN